MGWRASEGDADEVIVISGGPRGLRLGAVDAEERDATGFDLKIFLFDAREILCGEGVEGEEGEDGMA